MTAALALILSIAARPVLDLYLTEQPEHTADGIVCGLCSAHERTCGRTEPVRHASVAHVRHCYAAVAQQDAEHREEIAAERSAERYFEEGPNGGYYAGSEEEARDRWNDFLAGR